ncbi:hypothetical protein [Pseudogemmobacter humi]|uniref:Uncharacterized protein n=1 Tax=Pseudogemmobacter humi TaxID=2483812 RepID=A0A3P5XDV3_9RHOB|nr:hypothetical protein [Pseudogemmobacter humi]VDC33033.1 hypothetical protein XINFAN_03579 [Pseudogemmobacter humi]
MATLSTDIPRRSLVSRLPVLGRIAREIDEDTNTIFWLLPVVVLALVVAVQLWGWAALTMAALAMVPLVFAFFIAISWPGKL